MHGFKFRKRGKNRTLQKKASRGFEPRSLDSESRVLTVTPRGLVIIFGHHTMSLRSRRADKVVLFKSLRRDAETRDRTGDLQIFSLTLSQLSYRGLFKKAQAILSSCAVSPFLTTKL